MTARADCLAGRCPCSRPERPPACHTCPPDPRTLDELEHEHERGAYLDEYRDAGELARLRGDRGATRYPAGPPVQLSARRVLAALVATALALAVARWDDPAPAATSPDPMTTTEQENKP